MSRAGKARRAPGHCSNVMLALAAPTLAQNPPAEQSSHDVALVAWLNLPAGHDSQLVLAGLDVYWPGMHGKQTAPVSASATVPLGQAAQRGTVHKLGSSRCPRDELNAEPEMLLHASHASAPTGRCASSPEVRQGTSQVATSVVLPAP